MSDAVFRDDDGLVKMRVAAGGGVETDGLIFRDGDDGLVKMRVALDGGSVDPSDGSVTTAKLADGAVTDDKLANPKVNRAGDTMAGPLTLSDGLHFTNYLAEQPDDLSRHIRLHTNNWGIGIQTEKMNFVADANSANTFNFYNGNTLLASVVAGGIADAKDLTTKEYVDNAVSPKLTANQAAAQADSTATDAAGLAADFNALLAKLRDAGIIAT